MREIKFRVWDKCNERMVEPRNILKMCMSRLNQEPYLIVYLKKYMNANREIKESDKSYTNEFELMQSIGLKDKNGVEIYEGDILKGHNNPVDLVQVSFGEFGVVDMESETIIDNVIGWHTKVMPTDAISQAHPFCLDMPLTKQHVIDCEWEIIGNIHENPELLHRNKTVQEQCKEWKNE